MQRAPSPLEGVLEENSIGETSEDNDEHHGDHVQHGAYERTDAEKVRLETRRNIGGGTYPRTPSAKIYTT